MACCASSPKARRRPPPPAVAAPPAPAPSPLPAPAAKAVQETRAEVAKEEEKPTAVTATKTAASEVPQRAPKALRSPEHWDQLNKQLEEEEKAGSAGDGDDSGTADAPAAVADEDGPQPEHALAPDQWTRDGWTDVCGDGSLWKTILTPGDADADKPTTGSSVRCHYVGRLLDGSKFDSSRDRESPFEFTAGSGVIQGWSDGIVTMAPGELARFAITADKAYGAQGSPPKIPANATLQFEIELLSHTDFTSVAGSSPPLHIKQGMEGEGWKKPADWSICRLKLSLLAGGKSGSRWQAGQGGAALVNGLDGSQVLEHQISPAAEGVGGTSCSSSDTPSSYIPSSVQAVLKELKAGGSCDFKIDAADGEEEEELQGHCELISFDEVKDVSKAKDGGILMRVLSEGEGWKKPSELDICQVIYRSLATAALPADDDDGGEDEKEDQAEMSTEVLRIGQSELGQGVDQALKEMKKGSKVILTLAPENASVASRYAQDGAAGGKSNGKYHVQIELLSWTAVEDLSGTVEVADGSTVVAPPGSLLMTFVSPGQETDYKMPKDLAKCNVHFTLTRQVKDEGGEPTILLDSRATAAKEAEESSQMLLYYSSRDKAEPSVVAMYTGVTHTEESSQMLLYYSKAEPSVVAMYTGVPHIVDEGCRLGPGLQAQLPPAIDTALRKMKAGSRVTLQIEPSTYGQAGGVLAPWHSGEAEDKASATTSLTLDLELFSFENPKEPYEISGDGAGAGKLAAASALKNKGNAAFGCGELERARRRYVAAKAMLDSDHDMSPEDKASARELKISTLNNLATVCAKTGGANATDIPKHCDECLALDSKNVKALVRRGTFATERGSNLDAALDDLKAALALAPENKQAAKALRTCKKKRKEQNERDRALFSKMMGPGKHIVGLTSEERRKALTLEKLNNTVASQVLGREARLTQAVAFLKQPKIANAPRGTKIKYLQEKCFLTADELHEAFVTAYPLPGGAG